MNPASELSRALIDGGVPADRARALEPRAAEWLELGRTAHPDLPVDPARFAEHVAGILLGEGAGQLEETLGALRADDLYLAFACAHDVRGAASRLQGLAGTEIDRVNANQRSLRLSNDELRQLVLDRLLVREAGAHARILTFTGRGPLKAWIRVAATRIALDLARKKPAPHETPDDSDVFDRLPGAQDPEMAYMRTLYGTQLQEAFEAAFAQLTPRQRTVLRQRFAEQLTGDNIATIHGVHRATVFGWIEDARKRLLEAVRSELRARVRGTDATLDSVMALVAGGLDVSVGRLLGSGSD